MPSQIKNSGDEVDGFPFPRQPTPPTTSEQKSIDVNESPLTASSIRSLGSQVSRYLSNIDSNETVIIRGGFGPSKFEPVPMSMRCYPPPPNAAYSLTSQAYEPKEVENENIRSSPSPDITAVPEENIGKDVKGIDLDRTEQDLFPLHDSPKNVENNLDGFIHDNSAVTATTIDEEKKDKKHTNYNDLICIKPYRRPLITFTESVRQPPHSPINTDYNVSTIISAKENTVDGVGCAEKPLTSNSRGTKGKTLADTINFERLAWIIAMTTPGASGTVYSAEEQREDFIRNIDKDGAKLQYCSKCKTTHIPPGPPITLQDRDSCGSYLPDWFPTDEMEKPWDIFSALLNEMVTLDEVSQGYSHKASPDEPEWDLYFHEYHSKWRAVGRRGGWWKCRDGVHAPQVGELSRVP